MDLAFEIQAGQVFYLETAGGGGFGAPASRDLDSLARDIAEGYVSEAAAKEKYGA